VPPSSWLIDATCRAPCTPNRKGQSGEHARPALPSRYFACRRFPDERASVPRPEPFPVRLRFPDHAQKRAQTYFL
jgi:hypothetical protein